MQLKKHHSPKMFACTVLIEHKLSQQWRNVVGLANMAPLGDENAPLIGAPGVRAYLEQFVKKWPKNLNK